MDNVIRPVESSGQQLLACKVHCRQPEKFLLPPELTDLLSELCQFSPLVAGELTMLRRTEIIAVDACLRHPFGWLLFGN